MKGKFLEDNTFLIKSLAEKFQTHYNRVDREKIENYLKQFQSPSWMILALNLLQNIDYVDDGKISDMFREFYYEKLNEDKRRRAVFTILGGPQDSSSYVIYLCSKALEEKQNKEIKFQNLKEAIKNRKPQETILVFVDDNIGSGKQAIRIFQEWLGIAEGPHEYVPTKLEEKEIQWIKGTELVYFVLIGFTEGMNALKEELRKNRLNISIYPAMETKESTRCLQAGSLIFDNEDDRKEAIRMASTIGYDLLKDKNWPDELKKQRALGYGNSQKLIIFSYNTPTCTLPILWKRGTYQGRTWTPLFPRKEQKIPDIEDVNSDRQKYKIEEDISNPYDFEHPVLGEYFFGRKNELKKILDAIKEGRSTIIYGLQRIGKTSLVEEVLDVEMKKIGYDIIDLRIDMQTSYENFKTEIDFFITVINALSAKLDTADYETIKNGASKYFREYSDRRELREGFMRLLDLAKKKLGNKPFLLFIDEFQEINKSFESVKGRRDLISPINPELVRYLGSLSKRRLLQLLFCCRYQIIELDKQLDLQLLKIMRDIELGPLDNGSAKSLIQYPVKDLIVYEEPAVDKILTLTGGYPYLIQYICFELIEKVKVTIVGLIKEEDVDKIAQKMLSEIVMEPKFKLLYEDFQQIENGRPWKILLSIAQLAKQCREAVGWDNIVKTCVQELQLKGSIQDLNHAIKILTNSQIVGERREGKTLSYFIIPDILRQWLRNQNLFQKEIGSRVN